MDVKEIKNPHFLKGLNNQQLNELAKDIRSFLLDSLSKTGGHLSSNLGVVELTIAIHKFFNAPKDKILFDVGHQSYVHKILTGRAAKFNTLRQFGGLSGFQRINESEYDCFEAGHSSTALSTALGMAVARDLNGEDYDIVVVVGDGSLSSGLSLEALNQIGALQKKIIIIFNDNNMSISKNVGGLSRAFANVRSSRTYINIKNDVKDYLKTKKNGNQYIDSIKSLKENIKNKVMKPSLFNDFAVDYLGPIDGHNFNELANALYAAKSKDGPVVIHAVTVKGKGYKYAEADTNGSWHGVSKFNIETGLPLSKLPNDYKSYSKIVADKIDSMMAKDQNIVCITPAMMSGSCLNNIFAKYPNRAFDCGIAEDHALLFASGLALSGKKPFVSEYSSFLQRAYDQMNHDICRMNLPVVLGVDRSSIVGEDGSTHQGVFDISFLRPLPNLIIAEGKDASEMENLLELGFKCATPFVLRYPRGSIPYQNIKKEAIKVGKWQKIINNNNGVANIITYGNDVLKIETMIKENDLPYDLINARFIKPLDEKMLLEVASDKKPLFVYTNDMIKGGLGDSILECLNQHNLNNKVHIFGIGETYVHHGDVGLVKEELKLNLNYLFEYIKENA